MVFIILVRGYFIVLVVLVFLVVLVVLVFVFEQR
jgi:hypothetical protein